MAVAFSRGGCDSGPVEEIEEHIREGGSFAGLLWAKEPRSGGARAGGGAESRRGFGGRHGSTVTNVLSTGFVIPSGSMRCAIPGCREDAALGSVGRQRRKSRRSMVKSLSEALGLSDECRVVTMAVPPYTIMHTNKGTRRGCRPRRRCVDERV
eukprot:scaffold10887_cov109-Isochrysis_galbana.AAC.6